MFYELIVLLSSKADESKMNAVKTAVTDVVVAGKGEVIVFDNWGERMLAQATESGIDRGRFLYFVYIADTESNNEIQRRLSINESVFRNMIIKLDRHLTKEKVLKGYRNPFQSNEKENRDMDGELKDRKMFSKKKSCWFTANGTVPDWKDTGSYSWMINEFGKISPARVTGLSRKMQNLANQAVKRGRVMGLVSYLSNEVAR